MAPLQTVYEALRSLGVDALISIGGDDTLKTANKFKLFQDRCRRTRQRIPVVHLPKTIDNDYMGIDFTFGYFTAVDTLASEIRNLLADAEANRSYFLTETMGRSAGWLAYGAAIAAKQNRAFCSYSQLIVLGYGTKLFCTRDDNCGPSSRQWKPKQNPGLRSSSPS